MATLVNIYGDQDQIQEIVTGLGQNGVEHSEIYDAVTSSSKLNNPLSSPDLIIELLKFATAAIQTTGALIVLFTVLKQAVRPGKKLILIKESGGGSLEIDENTTQDQLRKFVG